MGGNWKRAKKINPIHAVMQSFSSSVVLCFLIFDELSCLLAQALLISVSSNFDPKPRNTFIFFVRFSAAKRVSQAHRLLKEMI